MVAVDTTSGDRGCKGFYEKAGCEMSQQRGYLFARNGSWNIRFYVHSDGVRKQRSQMLCPVDAEHSTKNAPALLKVADAFMNCINASNAVNNTQPHHVCPICKNRCPRTIRGTFTKVIHE